MLQRVRTGSDGCMAVAASMMSTFLGPLFTRACLYKYCGTSRRVAKQMESRGGKNFGYCGRRSVHSPCMLCVLWPPLGMGAPQGVQGRWRRMGRGGRSKQRAGMRSANHPASHGAALGGVRRLPMILQRAPYSIYRLFCLRLPLQGDDPTEGLASVAYSGTLSAVTPPVQGGTCSLVVDELEIHPPPLLKLTTVGDMVMMGHF